MPPQPDLLEMTGQVADLLEKQGVGAVFIGAAALAAHGYVRHTEDIDLGIEVAVRDLAAVSESLHAAGFEVVCREPDPRPRAAHRRG